MSKFDPPPSSGADPAPVPVHHNLQMEQGNAIPPNGTAPGEGSRCGNVMRIVALGLRGLSMVLSFLCFIILVTIKGFNEVDEYNYVFAVALISLIYNAGQNAQGVFLLVTRRDALMGNGKLSAMLDFVGDQVVTYMLISASSVGIALSNRGRQTLQALEDYSGTDLRSTVLDKTSGGSSMLFLAFVALIVPTVFSGHKLSKAFTCPTLPS